MGRDALVNRPKNIGWNLQSAFIKSRLPDLNALHNKAGSSLALKEFEALCKGDASPIISGTMQFSSEALKISRTLNVSPYELFFPPLPENPSSTYDKIRKLWSQGYTPDEMAEEMKSSPNSIMISFHQMLDIYFSPKKIQSGHILPKHDNFTHSASETSLLGFKKQWDGLSFERQMEPDALISALEYIGNHKAPGINWHLPETLLHQTTNASGEIRDEIGVNEMTRILAIYLNALEQKPNDKFLKALHKKCSEDEGFAAEFSVFVAQHQSRQDAPGTHDMGEPTATHS